MAVAAIARFSGRPLGGVLLVLALLFSAVLRAAPPVAVPALAGPVVDTTGALTPAQASALDAQARALKDRRGVQLQVLMLPTTGDEDIAAYAGRAFAAWKLGNAKTDNGVLVLVAKDDRRARIEVGYGLEDTLTDAQTSQIIRDVMVPFFKKGDFGGGLVAGTGRLVQLVDASGATEANGAAPAPAPTTAGRRDGSSGLLGTLGLVGVVCVMAANFLAGASRPARGVLLGAVGGGLGWFLLSSLLAGGLGALVGLLVGLVRAGGPGGRYARSGADSIPVITSWGGWGGGGWSGGGGSSGGGGASGSW